MSVFSKIKRSRQKAKEHTQMQAEKAKQEEVKVPYKHVPTHAAIDAMSGAPSGFREDDRVRILEQNRRRSAMAASGMNMNMPGIPRVASSLSHVTYPSAYANPRVNSMPRAHSYSGLPPMPMHMPNWPDRNGQVVYSVPESAAASIKGKEVDRIPMFDSGRGSSASSKAGSPVESSNASTSSQDDLEMRPARNSTPQAAASPQPSQGSRAAHRLHPSHSRRASDASVRSDTAPTPKVAPAPAPAPVVDRRPPPSTRGFSSIPPMPSLPPMQFNALPSNLMPAPPSVASSAASVSSVPSAPQSVASFNFSTNSSAATSAHTSAKSSISMPSTPAAMHVSDPLAMPISDAMAPAIKTKERRASKMTRFTELETIDSNVAQPAVAYNSSPEPVMPTNPPAVREPVKAPVPVVHEVVIQATPVAPPAKSGKRLSKQPGAKLTKKNRWSMRGGASAPVAV